MPSKLVKKTFFSLYGGIWAALMPFLRKNGRLAEGFRQRTLDEPVLNPADLWIQSASAGEAYLTWEILKRLPQAASFSILLTANTRQGIDILFQAARQFRKYHRQALVRVAYFPFDRPLVMQKAVHQIQPRVMVLLESELWPGLLYSLKRSESRILIINGRITQKSLARYSIWPSLWRDLRPDAILAISNEDAGRFARLFGKKAVAVMPNIKFDRLQSPDPRGTAENPLDAFLPASSPFLILGSIRRAEEKDALNILLEILRRHPDVVIGLFPRHMHRIQHWRQVLQTSGVSWLLRSAVETVIPGGSVILWDVFGELNPAYMKSAGAFVGGSLAPVGGQNFLEPVMVGTPTIIGPYWDNFKWVGKGIIDRGIVQQASSWTDVAEGLQNVLKYPPDKAALRMQALAYIRHRQGGTDTACRLIGDYL
ncbi:MAG: glycosyltransferase N-terminal domain-containing protein [Deltaproteobacteria bacterium]|jgi:3-deoxy-D-manno-octulosonic-acid transferase